VASPDTWLTLVITKAVEMLTFSATNLTRDVHRFVRVAAQEGILWSNRSDHQKALDALVAAEDAYRSFAKRHRTDEEDTSSSGAESNSIGDDRAYPWLSTELLPASPASECWSDFESAHTHTCYYLAQCYTHVGQPKRAAEYCQVTLRRQYEAKEYNALEWAVNCAALSQVSYTTARPCCPCSTSLIFRMHPKTIY
jgi:hypothetical protein